DHLRRWIGPVHTDHDQATLRHARLMAATIARPGAALQAGDALPPLWHWLYFLEGEPPAELGPDGHPARGGFLPPVPLPNRMWAGGRVEFEAAVPLGAEMEKRSQVLRIEHKQGRSGELIFVTVQHEVFVAGRRCLREEHDIVYKRPTPAAAPAAATTATPLPAPGAHQRVITPDATLLFRYSALTFNGHRIHYDQRYCREVEGYDDLVIHGPLNATLLAGLAAEVAGGLSGRPLRRFDYRNLNPVTLGATLTLHAQPDAQAGQAQLWLHDQHGRVALQASASWQDA
ncbi:MAG: MaoC family dehydratase N-terminal domain-containing protein, partial [Leptothrix sp. (in: b-proteobacteria)]